jgi:hypothetical protein
VLTSQQNTFLPRPEFIISLDAMNKRLEVIEKINLSRREQGEGIKQGWGWAVGVMGIVVAVVALLSKFIQ